MAGWLWSVVGEKNYFWDMATRTRRHWVIVASRGTPDATSPAAS